MKKFIKGLPYWINLYFFRHYKTTIPGVVSVAGGLSTIIYGAFPWKGKESFDLLSAGGAAVATGLGLIAAKDAGQTDAPQADPVTVRTVEGNLAEVKVADGEEPKA
jgi:hypothetical protein